MSFINYFKSQGKKTRTSSSTGLGVLASDNASGDLFNKSTILGSLTAGIYYVGVSAKGYNPQSAGGEIFQTTPDGFSTTFNPDPATSSTSAGAASPLSSWSTPVFPETGNYTITFTGAEFIGPTATPTPTPPPAIAASVSNVFYFIVVLIIMGLLGILRICQAAA